MTDTPINGGGIRCPGCGSFERLPRRFCGECGFDFHKSMAHAAERRSLTVMFCDLVGSTALSERLDPEELGEVILAYRDVVSNATTSFGGFVARYVGDGIVAYFGYPRAHDDDPVRALHAALETVERVRRISERGTRVQVRVGIHTGLVVVGDLARGTAREEAGVLGETPNVSARLMSLAPPDGILVSGVTQALAAESFNWRDVGDTPIRGLSRPVRIFELLSAARVAPGSLGATPHVTPLANRTEELALLEARWRDALESRGQAVAISGEPGIGKSRLVRAFADSLAGSDHLKMSFQCSPFFTNSAFHPVVDFLTRWLDKSDENPLEQLAYIVDSIGMDPAEVVPAMAALLSLPHSPRYPAPQVTGRVQRDLTMAFLSEWLMRLATDRATLIVIEDLHWADASTLELVTSLLDKLGDARILLLAAFRPQFQHPWGAHKLVANLRLDRLTAPHVHEMIALVTAGDPLSAALREQVALRTDGVPLFIEELTRAVLESPTLRDAAAPAPGQGELEIPISLHATLMARLDSMNAAKRVAQRASVLGREFSHGLLVATIDLPEAELEQGLTQLVDAELLFRFGTPPTATYLFKHSMIQETAYRSLLRTQRRDYHAMIADGLMKGFPGICEGQPELVAHHLTEARRPQEAAGYWRSAGERALARSANIEASAHLRKGLDELATCPPSNEKALQEVQLLVAYGSALSALKGSAATEVEQTYARARELCGQLGDSRHLFPVLRGLHSFYVVRGPLRTACSMVEELHETAKRDTNPLQMIEANRRLGWCRFCMGDIESGRTSLRESLEAYDRAQSTRHILTVGSDPGVIGLANLAWLEGLAGNPWQAVDYSTRAIELARELSFDLGLAYATGMSAALYQSLGDAARTAQLARETIELARRCGFPYWIAWETGLLGWAMAAQGETEAGIEMIEHGLRSYQETGSGLFCAHLSSLLADANLRAGRYDKVLKACEEGFVFSERTDAHFFDAELHRLEGEGVLGRDADAKGAANCFREAITCARDQGAGLLELRAAIRLAQLQHTRGDASGAARVLAESRGSFRGDPACGEYERASELLRAWD